MKICKKIKKIIMLAFAFLFCLTGTSCASEEERSDIDPNGNTLVESRLNETRAKEIYLKELILAEDMIAEQLFVEKNIQEVTLCQTVYVPQDYLEEFPEHSQISEFFDSDIDLKKY